MSVLSRIQHLFPAPQLMAFPCVGVDVSDTSLKYIAFECASASHRALTIRHWGDVDIPVGVVERGNVPDSAKLAEVLREMRARTKTEYIRMSLPEERAYLFETTVPANTPRKEIRGLLDFHLEENVPLSPRDVYFDYTIVARDPKTKDHRVVVAVYAQSTINSYYEACEQARVVPLSFEIEAQAVARAVVPRTGEGTYMIVDFGKTRMGVGIVHKGTLMYTSTIEIAGTQLSDEIRDVRGDISESEITEIKNTKGLARTAGNEQIADILAKHVKNMADEIATRIHYWGARSIDAEERALRKVYLCGGSANLHGLPEFLTKTLEIPTERAHVWENAFSLETYVPDIPRRFSYGYATAIGLALKNFETL